MTRVEGINPRTGMVVALCSIFLFFGFMFTVSGLKGERLGNVPLIAIGPAICFPGVVAIVVANKTNGCTEVPVQWRCVKKKQKKSQKRQTLSTIPKEPPLPGKWAEIQVVEDSSSLSIATRDSNWLTHKTEMDDALLYIRPYHPSSALVATRCISSYCVIEKVHSPMENTVHTGMQHLPFSTAVPSCQKDRDGTLLPFYWSFTKPRDCKLDYETIVWLICSRKNWIVLCIVYIYF